MILFETSILTLFSPKYKVYCGPENDGKSLFADSCEKCPQEESKCGGRYASCQWTNRKCIIDERASESFIFD